ncbi:VOC family protein [Psychromonas arctica]|uniref:VOC family protein n=1 Tax=Psychromonas arctica TaxID=168275 RepID=UPI00316ABEB8
MLTLGVEDIYAACSKNNALGGKVIGESGPVIGATSYCFYYRPDGYQIELIKTE